jgi:hypothetical protein
MKCPYCSVASSTAHIYEADFETGKVKEIYANYHGDPYSFSTEYPLEEKLSEVKRLSKVPIRNAKDVYNALTDRDTFDTLLQQGLDNEKYQRHRAEIVNLFMGLKEKDKIKIDDLTLYEPIFTSNIQKVNAPSVENLLIFIVLTARMSGYVLTIGNSMK